MLHVKLTVYYAVSFTCNMHFLNQHILFLNNLKEISFRVSFAPGYVNWGKTVSGTLHLFRVFLPYIKFMISKICKFGCHPK